MLKVFKTEIKAFIREFEKITKEYENSVNSGVSSITIHSEFNFSYDNIEKFSLGGCIFWVFIVYY